LHVREAKFFARFNRSVKLLAIALSLGLSATTRLPVQAATFTLTDADVVNALEKAKILAPSIRLNARVSQDEVLVATYKNPKADDKDWIWPPARCRVCRFTFTARRL
jgi:hypothetical protein